jgi:hypothetical protein
MVVFHASPTLSSRSGFAGFRISLVSGVQARLQESAKGGPGTTVAWPLGIARKKCRPLVTVSPISNNLFLMELGKLQCLAGPLDLIFLREMIPLVESRQRTCPQAFGVIRLPIFWFLEASRAHVGGKEATKGCSGTTVTSVGEVKN